MGAPTIAAGLRQVLLPYAPFSRMGAADLEFLVGQAEVAYFEPGETVLAPRGEVADRFFIVKQGRVRGLRDGKAEQIAFEGGVGDIFPVGALLAQRPHLLTYVAVGDVFCLVLGRRVFDALVQRSPQFLDFCQRRIGSLLDQSRQELQANYAAAASAERTMNLALGELVRGAPVTCRPGEPLRVAFSRMHDANVGSVLVTEPEGDHERVVGILTRTDLIGRVILPEVPLSTPIAQVMSTGVLTLPAEATAADASLLMAEHTVRHVPVVRTEGDASRVIGIVSERDLFTLQRLSVRQLAAGIRGSTDLDALSAVAADIRRLSHHLVAQGVAAAQMTRLISHLNDQLAARLFALGCERFDIPPDAFCWLALGSEGRGEQTIATDQDNGLLLDGARIEKPHALAFAQWVNQALAQCGFPLCKGGIMAGNPRWCLTGEEWSAQFADWIDRGDPDSLLNASIFFDFRGLAGERGLATALRAEVVARAQRNARFLKQMSDNALRNRAPGAPTVFDRLLGDELGKEPVDLKLHGTVPFVDAARIWALGAGLTQTNTTLRFKELLSAGRLPEEDTRAWIDSFEFLQLLRLRVQHAQSASGEPEPENPNRLDPLTLSPLDRRILQEAFRQARRVQQRLELDFPG